jgi:DNA-binding MarR family transcriptional regulator
MSESDTLKLENQLCFPLYACSKELVRHYTPLLKQLDLTYTQYITMMVMWESRQINVRKLGEMLYLDSGTLTPLLKKLEGKGYVSRERNPQDERELLVTLTEKGLQLKDEAAAVPAEVGKCVGLSGQEAQQLYGLLYKMLGVMNEQKQ